MEKNSPYHILSSSAGGGGGGGASVIQCFQNPVILYSVGLINRLHMLEFFKFIIK